MSNFVLPQISQLVLKDRKEAAVGLTRLLTQSKSTLSLKEPNLKTFPPLCRIDRSHRLRATGRSSLLGQFAGLFRETNAFASEADGGTGAEEQAARYRAAYSKLATVGIPAQDGVVYAGDVRVHVTREFTRLLGAEPGMKMLVEMVEGLFFASLGVSTVWNDGEESRKGDSIEVLKRGSRKKMKF